MLLPITVIVVLALPPDLTAWLETRIGDIDSASRVGKEIERRVNNTFARPVNCERAYAEHRAQVERLTNVGAFRDLPFNERGAWIISKMKPTPAEEAWLSKRVNSVFVSRGALVQRLREVLTEYEGRELWPDEDPSIEDGMSPDSLAAELWTLALGIFLNPKYVYRRETNTNVNLVNYFAVSLKNEIINRIFQLNRRQPHRGYMVQLEKELVKAEKRKGGPLSPRERELIALRLNNPRTGKRASRRSVDSVLQILEIGADAHWYFTTKHSSRIYGSGTSEVLEWEHGQRIRELSAQALEQASNCEGKSGEARSTCLWLAAREVSLDRIAEELSVPVTTVKSLMHRARTALRRCPSLMMSIQELM